MKYIVELKYYWLNNYLIDNIIIGEYDTQLEAIDVAGLNFVNYRYKLETNSFVKNKKVYHWSISVYSNDHLEEPEMMSELIYYKPQACLDTDYTETYRICIPSYKRAETLKNKTLKMLTDFRIPKDLIYIFVASIEELEEYVRVLGSEWYRNIVVGQKGMANIRNFITNYFEEGDNLVMIDDDVADIKCFNTHFTFLTDFFTWAFELCLEQDCRLWGVYPVNNAFYMKPTVTFGLQYICGGMYGVINNKKLLVDINDKEDHLRSIQYFLEDGNTLRFNYVGIDTKGYSGKGGGMNCKGERTNAIILEASNKLVERYPEYAKLNLKKKIGKPDIKLNRIINKKIELSWNNLLGY